MAVIEVVVRGLSCRNKHLLGYHYVSRTILNAGGFLRDAVKIIFLFKSGKDSRRGPDQSKWRTRPAAILAAITLFWWFL